MIKYLFYVSTVIIVASCRQAKQVSPDDKLPITAYAVPLKDSGWSYEVYVDNKLFIKQQFIPAVQGYHVFKTKQDALITAKLVVEKIKEGKQPTLTLEDIQQSGIGISDLQVKAPH